MPLFNTVCTACGNLEEDVFVSFKNLDKIPPCSKCGEPTEKTVGKANFVLKGNGWAKDGYGN